jgi:hypothetical protein
MIRQINYLVSPGRDFTPARVRAREKRWDFRPLSRWRERPAASRGARGEDKPRAALSSGTARGPLSPLRIIPKG